MYQIKFTLGEKTGEIVPLTHNQTISIGRSHTNDICLKAADVSGKHVIIRSGSGSNLSIEILSSRTTKHNGKNISLFTRICGRNPVPGVRQAGDISTLLQF